MHFSNQFDFVDHRFRDHSQQPKASNEIEFAEADGIDEDEFPIGGLTLEQFLQLEDDLRRNLSSNIRASKASIQQSFLLLQRLIQEHEANLDILDHYEMAHWIDGNYPRCTKLLDECLRNWMKWWELNSHGEQLSPEVVESFLETLRSGRLPMLVTDQTYRVLIDAAIRGGTPEEVPLFVDRLIDQMLEESLENPRLRPTEATLQSALRAWSESGLPQAPDKAEALFQTILALHEDAISDDSTPGDATYIAMMKTWSNSDRKGAPEKVEGILNLMKTSPFPFVAPSTAAYRLAVHSWINSKDPKSTARAYALFLELVHAYMESRDERIMIDSHFFSIMISTLAKERECEKAEEIFHLLEELFKLTQDKRFEPSTKTLLGMIIAHSKSKKPGAAKKAESILLDLEGLAQTKVTDGDLPPKRGYYSDVIHALVKGSPPEGLDRAEVVLTRMVKHHRAGWDNILPDKALFDQVIDGWSRIDSKAAPSRAEGLLWVMHNISNDLRRNDTKPDEKTYFHAITAWARSRDSTAPERAEKLFFDMLERYNEGDATMKPSMIHYTTLINSWARSSHPDGPLRAQQAFETVIAFYASGDKDFTPDSQLYTSLMRAWARRGDANIVESIFLQMFEAYASSKRKKMMPSTMSFNILLEAWLKSGNPEAHKKAKLVYDSMIEFTEEQTLNVRPDGYTFSTIVDIMLRCGYVEQAEKYLELMKAARVVGERRGHEKVIQCYISTMEALSKKSGLEATSKVETLTNELINLSKSGKIPLFTKSEYGRFLSVVANSNVPGKAASARAALELGEQINISRDILPKELKRR